MKLPSSSSFVAAALIASSSIPSLAAPTAIPNSDMAISSGNQFVASQSKNITHSAAEKDEQVAEKGLLDALGELLHKLLNRRDPSKDKASGHEKRFENVDSQASRSSESRLPRDRSNSANDGQPSRAAFGRYPRSSHGQD
ncbi:hypothetical protein J132_10600 [Termitomyces sp. J132]|nr:hypothetical protein J132_10600 [Termitomyces sp. J132]